MMTTDVQVRYPSFRSLLDACLARVATDGMFLETSAAAEVGEEVGFDVGLSDDFPVLRGSGRVVWRSEGSDSEGAGLAIRFTRVDESTERIVAQMIARQTERGPVYEVPRPATEDPAPESAVGTIEVEVLRDPAPEVLPSQEPAEEAIEAEVVAEAPKVSDSEPVVEPAEPRATEVPEVPEQEGLEAPPSESLEQRVLAEADSSESRRSSSPLLLALLLIGGLLGLGYWQRDWIRGALEQSPRASETAVAEVGPSGGESEAADVTEETPAAAGEQPAAEQPAPAQSVEQAGDPDSDLPEDTPRPAVAEPLATGPATSFEEVGWVASQGSTLLVLRGNGTITSDRVSSERLDDPPRILVKVQGIDQRLAQPTRAIGSEEVVGVRTGLHSRAGGSELHVVVDLASPTAELSSLETDGARLQLRISSTAIAP